MKKLSLALAVVAVSAISAFADGELRTMVGTPTGTASSLKNAFTWSLGSGVTGDVVTPWQSGSNECSYVIKMTKSQSINGTGAFPDVPLTINFSGSFIYGSPTSSKPNISLTFPKVAIGGTVTQGFRLNANGIQNASMALAGKYTVVSSGGILPLGIHSLKVGLNQSVVFLPDNVSSLVGGADTIVNFVGTINNDPSDGSGSNIVDFYLTVSGNASGFDGIYRIQQPSNKTTNDVTYVGRTHFTMTSATAFGNPESEKSDAVMLDASAYLTLGPAVEQYATRGIRIATNRTAGVEAASGSSWTLTAPVTCDTGATFAKIGAGTVTIAGDSTGASAMEVAEGTLVLGEYGTFPSGLSVVVSNGATLIQRKYIPGLSVTGGGTCVREVRVPYDAAENRADPLDMRDGLPELPMTVALSESIDIAYFAAHGYDTNRIEVAKLPSGATAAADDFEDATEKTYGLPRTHFEIEDKDGYKALVLVASPVVASTRNIVETDGGLNTENTPLPWSDGKSAHPGADYLLTNKLTRTGTSVFNGDSLTVGPAAEKVELRYADRENSRLDKTVVYAGIDIEPNHSSLKNARLNGDLLLSGDFGSTVAAKCIVFRTIRATNSNVMRLDLAAELKGEGSSFLGISDNCMTGACESLELEVSGLNTNYHGVFVAIGGNIWVNNVSTNSEFAHMNLVIGDARNLGGPLPEFTMDALRLTNHSMLKVKNDVTLDTENRGIYVTSKNGGFIVPNDTALTIMEKFTLQGAFYKRGAGTLALGGDIELRGGEASVGFVREGAVKALADKAVAGLGLVFSDGAAIALDPDAEIENGFTGDLSTVNPGEKIALRLEPCPADGRAEFTIPVCTVPTASGDISGLFSMGRSRGYTAQLVTSSVEVDSVACTRYSVCYRRKGLVLTFR